MPLVRRRRIPLPLENMAQMPPTITAHNLRARHAERAVHVARDSARQGIEERGPATTGFKLMRGFIERGRAAGAGVDTAGGHVLVVNAGVGGFGAFFAEDSELFCGRFV